MTATWAPLTTNARSVTSTQALTEAAPTLATEGLDISGLGSVTPVVTAPDGQTFTGAGSLIAYVRPSLTAAWVRLPHADDDIEDAAGLNTCALQARPIIQASGRFALIGSGVGLSGGTTFTLALIAADRNTGAAS